MVTVNKSGRLGYFRNEWPSAVWQFWFFLFSDIKNQDQREPSGVNLFNGERWNALTHLERNKSESIYLEGFYRSRARAGVSNRIRDPGSSCCKRCRQGIIFYYKGRTQWEIIVLGLWGNYDRKAETWRNWRKGTPGVEPAA